MRRRATAEGARSDEPTQVKNSSPGGYRFGRYVEAIAAFPSAPPHRVVPFPFRGGEKVVPARRCSKYPVVGAYTTAGKRSPSENPFDARETEKWRPPRARSIPEKASTSAPIRVRRSGFPETSASSGTSDVSSWSPRRNVPPWHSISVPAAIRRTPAPSHRDALADSSTVVAHPGRLERGANTAQRRSQRGERSGVTIR